MSTAQQLDDIFYEELYKKYYSPITCFVHTYLYDISKAEDIAQKTFMLLWEKREEIDLNKSVKSYLFTTAKNLAIDHLKHKKIQQKFFDEQITEISHIEHDLNIEALTILNEEEIERHLKIKRIILDLPLSDRKIFILSKFDNLTYSEIAEILGISPKTVEKRISLSIKFLRKKITLYIITL